MPERIEQTRDVRPTIAKFALSFRDPIGVLRIESTGRASKRRFGKVKNIRRSDKREFQYLEIFVIIKEYRHMEPLDAFDLTSLEPLVNRQFLSELARSSKYFQNAVYGRVPEKSIKAPEQEVIV